MLVQFIRQWVGLDGIGLDCCGKAKPCAKNVEVPGATR